MKEMVIEVDSCELCPMFSRDIDDSEYCSRGGSPESRYAIGGWEVGVPKKVNELPSDCPLTENSITVKLVDHE